jgi:hypothetical protein
MHLREKLIDSGHRNGARIAGMNAKFPRQNPFSVFPLTQGFTFCRHPPGLEPVSLEVARRVAGEMSKSVKVDFAEVNGTVTTN